jgi:hypothetical protein
VKFAFIDVEYTGEHARTTLVSFAVVGMGDEKLSLVLNDYDERQVTPWLRANVLTLIDPARSVDRRTAYEQTAAWFEAYSGGDPVSLVSAGKLHDIILLFELWHQAHLDWDYFHYLHGLPPYLVHNAHFDLPTILFLAGLDPAIDREELIGHSIEGVRHDALYDALVVRECFLRCVTRENFPRLERLFADGSPQLA